MGVPFFGGYQQEDILHMVEIAAHVPMRESARMRPSDVEAVESLCKAYDDAYDKAQFIEANPAAGEWWFGNRFSEWKEFTALTAGLNLQGMKVLDIGAGPGFDAWRLFLLGARVTALESNPILASLGRTSFPEIRYVGGFSHALPFANESFDAVFINAALHHMHDLGGACAEAARVLKRGGELLTTGDPFRASGSSDEDELRIFDRHTGVLSGINENIIRLPVLREAMQRLGPVEFRAHLKVDHAPSADLRGTHIVRSVQQMERFDQCAGSVGMRVRPLAQWLAPRRVLPPPLVTPEDLEAWLSDQAVAMARLARFLPAEHVNAGFPGTNSKFQLLNGWRLRSRWEWSRRAYVRGRWFLRRGPRQNRLRFDVRADSPTEFRILVNSRVAHTVAVRNQWTTIICQIDSVPAGETFALEIVRGGTAETFDEGCFRVRRRKFLR